MQKNTLEVGLNDNGEIVVNHPDLEPDENGVGHIVFSADQAKHFAKLLLKWAAESEDRAIEKSRAAYDAARVAALMGEDG